MVAAHSIATLAYSSKLPRPNPMAAQSKGTAESKGSAPVSKEAKVEKKEVAPAGKQPKGKTIELVAKRSFRYADPQHAGEIIRVKKGDKIVLPSCHNVCGWKGDLVE